MLVAKKIARTQSVLKFVSPIFDIAASLTLAANRINIGLSSFRSSLS